jgi:hypothetical protein
MFGQYGFHVLGESHPGILVSQRLNSRQTLREYQQALPEPFFASLGRSVATLEFRQSGP